MRKLTQAEVARRMREVDIEPLEPYMNSRTPMWVMGLKPACGHMWRTRPNWVITMGKGCAKCARVAPLTHKEVAERLMAKNIELLEPYKGIHAKVLVRSQCGHEWRVGPNSVLANGRGCPQCGGTLPLTQKHVEQKFQQKDLLLLDSYVSNHKKVLTRCLKCSHEWKVMPSTILNTATGCPECSDGGGFKDSQPGILYYMRVSNPFGGCLYKLGITNFSSAEKRFKPYERKKITKIWIIGKYSVGSDAKREEQRLLGKHFYDRYWGPKILKRGDTELFNVDVLGLDSS